MQGHVFVELCSFHEIPGFSEFTLEYSAHCPFFVESLLVIQTGSMNVLRGSATEFYGQRVINSHGK